MKLGPEILSRLIDEVKFEVHEHGKKYPTAMTFVIQKRFQEHDFDEALRQLASELGKRGASKRQRQPGKSFLADHLAQLKCPIEVSTTQKQVQSHLFTYSAQASRR